MDSLYTVDSLTKVLEAGTCDEKGKRGGGNGLKPEDARHFSREIYDMLDTVHEITSTSVPKKEVERAIKAWFSKGDTEKRCELTDNHHDRGRLAWKHIEALTPWAVKTDVSEPLANELYESFAVVSNAIVQSTKFLGPSESHTFLSGERAELRNKRKECRNFLDGEGQKSIVFVGPSAPPLPGNPDSKADKFNRMAVSVERVKKSTVVLVTSPCNEQEPDITLEYTRGCHPTHTQWNLPAASFNPWMTGDNVEKKDIDADGEILRHLVIHLARGTQCSDNITCSKNLHSFMCALIGVTEDEDRRDDLEKGIKELPMSRIKVLVTMLLLGWLG